MSLTSPSCWVSIIPRSRSSPHKVSNVHLRPGSTPSHHKCKIPGSILLKSKRKETPCYLKVLAAKGEAVPFNDEWPFDEQDNVIDLDFGDEDDEGSPWEGVVVYRRSKTASHLEYCTTLERLGLGKLSSEISVSRASVMGLRVTKSVEEYADGTPVLISIDVTKKQNRLRLDGLVRTVITLDCNRCGEPAAEDVFSNFSLLLTEEPIKEPKSIDLEMTYEEDKFKGPTGPGMEDELDDDASIDLDDRLYFPPDQKEIDISKHIRDMVHLEIKIDAICDSSCKGICLQCGANLNFRSCTCTGQEVKAMGYSPLGNLRKQLHRR